MTVAVLSEDFEISKSGNNMEHIIFSRELDTINSFTSYANCKLYVAKICARNIYYFMSLFVRKSNLFEKNTRIDRMRSSLYCKTFFVVISIGNQLWHGKKYKKETCNRRQYLRSRLT